MKIGKLAQATGCTVETIRFYEKQGLLAAPKRTAGNFREYTHEHLERLSFICYCRTLDISLSDIKQLLAFEQTQEPEAKAEMNALLDRHIRDVVKQIHKLDHLRLQLIGLKNQINEHPQEQTVMGALLQHSRMRFVGIK